MNIHFSVVNEFHDPLFEVEISYKYVTVLNPLIITCTDGKKEFFGMTLDNFQKLVSLFQE